jgi:hypothetical protein
VAAPRRATHRGPRSGARRDRRGCACGGEQQREHDREEPEPSALRKAAAIHPSLFAHEHVESHTTQARLSPRRGSARSSGVAPGRAKAALMIDTEAESGGWHRLHRAKEPNHCGGELVDIHDCRWRRERAHAPWGEVKAVEKQPEEELGLGREPIPGDQA